MLAGTHDFRNFCHIDNSKCRLEASYKRTILSADVVQLGFDTFLNIGYWAMIKPIFRDPRVDSCPYNILKLTIRASGFLWHQIRCIVSVIYEVGMKNESPEVHKLIRYWPIIQTNFNILSVVFT